LLVFTTTVVNKMLIHFWQVASTITALSTHDERIAEEFRSIEKGRLSTGRIVEIEGDVPVGMKSCIGSTTYKEYRQYFEKIGRWSVASRRST
jgi:uncharacterized protein (DUF2126 family)